MLIALDTKIEEMPVIHFYIDFHKCRLKKTQLKKTLLYTLAYASVRQLPEGVKYRTPAYASAFPT